jgi:hypothetical protein
VFEKCDRDLEPGGKWVALHVLRPTSRHDLGPPCVKQLSGDRPAKHVGYLGQVVHRAGRSGHLIARAKPYRRGDRVRGLQIARLRGRTSIPYERGKLRQPHHRRDCPRVSGELLCGSSFLI